MNLAQLWQLPVIFVCENNRYAELTPPGRLPVDDLAAAPGRYGMHTMTVDGNDVAMSTTRTPRRPSTPAPARARSTSRRET